MLALRKKKPDEWLPVEPAPESTWLPVEEVKGRRGPEWIPAAPSPPAEAQASKPPPAPRKPAASEWAPPAAGPAATKPVARTPKDRELWADPVLSPWAPPPASATTPARPTPPAPGFDSMGSTRCPRCDTAISYPRRGSPPWEAVCPECGARGKMTK